MLLQLKKNKSIWRKKLASLKKNAFGIVEVVCKNGNSCGCVHVTNVGNTDLVETSKERTGSVGYF